MNFFPPGCLPKIRVPRPGEIVANSNGKMGRREIARVIGRAGIQQGVWAVRLDDGQKLIILASATSGVWQEFFQEAIIIGR